MRVKNHNNPDGKLTRQDFAQASTPLSSKFRALDDAPLPSYNAITITGIALFFHNTSNPPT